MLWNVSKFSSFARPLFFFNVRSQKKLKMSDTVHLYGMGVSAGCRLTQWVANICEVPYEFHTVDLAKGDHLKPTYVKQTRERHCIPSMVHEVCGDRLCITESRAIARYLIRIGNGAIYEFHNPMWAAEVDELVDYEATCLYKRVSKCAYARLFSMGDVPTEKDFEALNKSLQYIEARLGNAMHLVGGSLTLADVLLANTLSMLVVVPEIDMCAYPAVQRWLGCLYQYGDYNDVAQEFYEHSESITREEDLGSCSSECTDFGGEEELYIENISSSDSSCCNDDSEGLSESADDDDDQSVVSVLSVLSVLSSANSSNGGGFCKSDDGEEEPASSTTSDGYVNCTGHTLLEQLSLVADNSTDTTNMVPQPCCGEPKEEPKE